MNANIQNNLNFIKQCVQQGRIYWTYHSNMRLAGRSISRKSVIQYIKTAKIIEMHENDFPLPSCLCLVHGSDNKPIHIVIALDKSDNNVRFITLYKPDPEQWNSNFTERKTT